MGGEALNHPLTPLPVRLELEDGGENDGKEEELDEETEMKERKEEEEKMQEEEEEEDMLAEEEEMREEGYIRLLPDGEYFNRKFRVIGKRLIVRLIDRPEEEDNPVAFASVMGDLTRILRDTMSPDDYVQLVFVSPDLQNPFFVPLVRMSLERFANILSSNAHVDVGHEDFLIRVYQCQVPRGAGKSNEELRKAFGISTEKLLRRKRSLFSVPLSGDPHCLILAMQLAVAFMDKKHKHMFRSEKKVSHYKHKASELRFDLNLPVEGPLSLDHLRVLAKVPPFSHHPIYVYERQGAQQIFRANVEIDAEPISLFLHDNHYSVITSVTGFFFPLERVCFVKNATSSSQGKDCTSAVKNIGSFARGIA